MRNQLYIAAALQLTFCWVLPAQSTILFQTTTPPSAGQPSGGTISTTQYIGNYFVLTTPSHVDSISTAASVTDNGTIFGAILAVPNLATLPTGTPFGTSGPSAPLVTTTLKPNSTNAIVTGSAPVDLPAGAYVLIFGTGQFGASTGTANLAFSDGTKASLPAGANQVNYGPSCNNGTTPCWSAGFGAPSPFYFAVSGTNGLSSITSLNPNFAAPGGPSFTLTVNGTGFQPTSTVGWNGVTLATTYVSATQLTAAVPANLIATAGSAGITVTTNSVATPAFSFTIGASSGPTITSINPPGIPPGSAGFNLTINGSGFVSGAIVLWNGQFLISNFNSSSQLTATVSSGLLTTGGIASVTVQNPNNGGTSNSVNFVIGQVSNIPSLSSVTPTSAAVGGATFTLTVNGSNFTTNSAVQWNNTLLPTTFVSATQLTASVNSSLLVSATTATVSVNNPGAGTSNSLSFPVVSSSGPAITSLSPATVAPGGQAFTLTVNGSNFTSLSAVLWNGALLATTYVSATQLTATVPATLIATAGTGNITVNNPGNVTSNSQTFNVSATPPPVLSSLSPAAAAPGGPQFTLTVNGSSFTQNSAVSWNGSLLATTYVSPTQLTATVGANLIAAAGTANVTVTTPSAGTSSPLTFTIAVPNGPTITNLSPSSATPGSASFLILVNGSGFTNASLVQWNGNPLVTLFLSATQLQASVSSTLIATAGTANVTVASGNTTSNAVPFTIGAPNTPILTSLSPNSTTVGGPQFTLTANGSNFANGATLVWNGGLLSTTFVSATQLTATVPSSLIAAVGTASVTVTNPSGTNATSNALNFAISNAASPTLSSLSPTTTNAGGAGFTLTVNGQGFLSGASVRWNGSALATTTLVSSTQLTATVPASLISSPGTATITVANQGGSISNSLIFNITSSSTSTTLFQTTLPPTSGQQASASLSSGQFLGNYFVLTAPAHIDSIATYAQASDGGTIFGAILSVPSLTSAPSGSPFDGTTVATATLRPGTTSSIVTAPVSVDLPAGTYVVVFGSGYFGANSTTALAAFSNGGNANVPAGWNQVSWGLYCSGGLNTCWSANFASPSQFYFAVTGTPVTAPALSITSLNPSATTAGGSAFTLTVNGTGFASGSTVQWNGSSLPTTFVSATQLTASVSANLVSSVGAASVTVLTSVGAISNAATFTISSPVSSISSLNPPSATAGGPAFTLTVNGSGFSSGSTLQWNGSPLPTTFVNSTQVTVNVPANLIANPGSASLTVLGPSGLFSNFVNFTISSATPNISSLNPNTVTVGSAGFTMLVTGTGFLSGSTVLWSGSAVATTYVSGTQLSATIPANLVANVGSISVTVQNPGSGAVSNAVAFIVNPVGTGNASAGLAHYAVGSNWTTAIFVVNSGASIANYSISFYDDNGNPAALPFSSGSTARLSGTLPAYGSVYIEAANPTGPLISGWGQITADSGIVIQSLFRSTLNNTHYEAAVASSTGSKAFELPFDANNFAVNVPLYTGIAIANLDSANTAQIFCIARDASGTVIPNGVAIPTIRPLGHWAGFQFPVLVGQRGTIDCTSSTNVAVIALRFIGTDTFSSLPVIKK